MTAHRSAYLPLATFPEAVSDEPVRAAVQFVAAVGSSLHVTAFSVDLPPMYSPMGGVLLDVGSLVSAAEERSAAECSRVQAVVTASAGPELPVDFGIRRVQGAAWAVAAGEARYHDLAVLPWSPEQVAAREMIEAVIFGSGRPAIVVPPVAGAAPSVLNHVAIGWDGSRVAARALADALMLLPEGARITVLTVTNEKPLDRPDLGAAIAAGLARSGYAATPVDVALGGKGIGVALQEAALAAGAQMLAMGGFGHSRFRDMVLGGATKGVLADLRMPVLLSH
jgi:nucleotide-binding universal stress UspA family protein